MRAPPPGSARALNRKRQVRSAAARPHLDAALAAHADEALDLVAVLGGHLVDALVLVARGAVAHGDLLDLRLVVLDGAGHADDQAALLVARREAVVGSEHGRHDALLTERARPAAREAL